MIHAVKANKSTFKTVQFHPGFNVVLADRTKESTKKDTRNGLGKSTLVEIIHFCLGSKAKTGKGLLIQELSDWIFSLDITLAGKPVTVSRSVSSPSKVIIEGDCSHWPIQPQKNPRTRQLEMPVQRWTLLLGALFFGIEIENNVRKYTPAFRSLISYFIRKGSGAFLNPFENYQRQKEFDKQISNAFLLSLSWEDASDWQDLKDRERALDSLKEAAKSGVVSNLIGSLGELETHKMRLEQKVAQYEANLQTFEIHPQYKEIEEKVDSLTRKIHDLSNQNVIDRQVISNYERSLQEEKPVTANPVMKVYEEANVVIPEMVKKKLEEVKDFHTKLIHHRQAYLNDELKRLKTDIEKRDKEIKTLSEERAKGMQILQSHRALDEYTKLQQELLELVSQLKDIDLRIDNLRKFQQGKSALRIEKELLHQRTLNDFDDRRVYRQKAIDLFNGYSEELYRAPGTLIIDPSNTGFKFDVEIDRSGSEGIDRMKVFFYDLMLARIWSYKSPSPKMLVHDSTLFDPVDSRQFVSALELAAREAENHGFQYICMLNSDKIPQGQFSQGFDIDKYVRLRLTDATDDGSLLGVRVKPGK